MVSATALSQTIPDTAQQSSSHQNLVFVSDFPPIKSPNPSFSSGSCAISCLKEKWTAVKAERLGRLSTQGHARLFPRYQCPRVIPSRASGGGPSAGLPCVHSGPSHRVQKAPTATCRAPRAALPVPIAHAPGAELGLWFCLMGDGG